MRDLPTLPIDLLTALFHQFRTIFYYRDEADDVFALDVTDHAGHRVKVVRADPESMVRAALGREVHKVCRACGEAKPLADFGHNRDNRDGRLYRCKVCERARVRLYQMRKSQGN